MSNELYFGVGNSINTDPTLRFGRSNNPYMSIGMYGQNQQIQTPQSSLFGSDGFGWNSGTLSGIGALGSSLFGAWNGYQQNKIAKDQLNFQKNFANRNLANTAQTLNTQLEDRQNARNAFDDAGNEDTSDYLKRHKVDGSKI